MKNSYYLIAAFSLAFLACGKEKGAEKEAHSSQLPPVVSPSELPDFVRKYKLYYPGAEAHKAESAFLLKTFDELEAIEKFYRERANDIGFAEIAAIRQHEGILLQYRNDKENAVISVDVQKLPYARNKLIRLGFSQVDPSVLK